MKHFSKLLFAGVAAAAMMPCASVTAAPSIPFGTLKPTRSSLFSNESGSMRQTSVVRQSQGKKVAASIVKQSPEVAFGMGHQTVSSTSMKRVAAETFVVSLDLPTAGETAFAQAVGFTAAGGVQEWAMQDETGAIFAMLPPGTYTAVAYYVKVDEEGYQCGTAYVVKENIEVKGDMNLTLDPAVATNFITMKTYNTAGEENRLTRVCVDYVDGEPDIVVLEEGNLYFVEQRMSLYSATLGELFWSQISASSQWEDSENFQEGDPLFSDMAGIWINEVSSDIFVGGNQMVNSDNYPMAYIDLVQKGSAAGVLSNEGADYMDIVTKLQQSGLGKSSIYPPNPEPWGLDSYHYIGSEKISGMGVFSAADLSSYSYCGLPRSMRLADYNTSVQATYSDYTSYWSVDTTYFDEWMVISEERTSSNMACPEMMINSDDNTLSVFNLTLGDYYDMPSAPSDLPNRVPAMMRYTESQQMVPYGATPAFCASLVISESADGMSVLKPFSPTFMGYGGEGQYAITSCLSNKMWYNGEPIPYDEEYYSDFWSGGFWGWCYDWNDEGHPAGKMALSFYGPMIVDNLDGGVTYDVAFDQTKADNVPPSVQYLQFRDGENNLTNLFGTPSEGVMRMSAGDFAMTGDVLEYVAGVEPTVYYSPFGTDTWTPMTLRTVADAYECFAPTYEAELSQVAGSSENGWFDVKIEMADASGNTMSQSFSPAFCIDSLSGVKTLAADRGSMTFNGNVVCASATCKMIEVYAASGAKMMSVAGNRADLSALPSGIYIVKAGSATLKVRK